MTTMNNLVFKGQNNQVLTNSLLVAEKFGKNHKDVIEVITSILVKAENSAQTDNQQLAKMFALVEYDVPLNNGTGAVRKAPMYVMNRDGFTLLAMGFTGEKALKFKLDYINAFNQMEETIKSGIKIGQNRLFQLLRDEGYLCKTGENYNLPTQRAMEMNLFEIKKTIINKPDGTILVTTTTKVTGKGQIYFINKFLREKQQKQAV